VGTFFCHPLFVAAKGQTMGCCEQWQQAVFCGFVCRHMKWNSFGLLGEYKWPTAGSPCA